jgi:hypothetical protein
MRTKLKLAIALVLCAPSLLAPKAKPLPDPALAEITTRGQFLAEYDVAAWHATDAVLALKPDSGAVKRYVARKTDAGWIVVFGRFNDAQNAFLIAYEATQGSGPQQFTVQTYDPPHADTGFFYVAAKAIGLSLQSFQAEDRPYNTYVLPLDSGQMYVYVLPAQTVADVYPLGGDARYLVSADGSTIIESRQLHKTILEMKSSPPSGGQQVAGFNTDVLSDVPVDTDVFFVLARKPPAPEFVATQKGMYEIDTDGTIVRVK